MAEIQVRRIAEADSNIKGFFFNDKFLTSSGVELLGSLRDTYVGSDDISFEETTQIYNNSVCKNESFDFADDLFNIAKKIQKR